MDAKTGYSTMVTGSKSAATTNEELNKKITAGQGRKAIHGANWTSVNINTIVDRFTPGAAPEPQQRPDQGALRKVPRRAQQPSGPRTAPYEL